MQRWRWDLGNFFSMAFSIVSKRDISTQNRNLKSPLNEF
jgi:hypothetical protein